VEDLANGTYEQEKEKFCSQTRKTRGKEEGQWGKKLRGRWGEGTKPRKSHYRANSGMGAREPSSTRDAREFKEGTRGWGQTQ